MPPQSKLISPNKRAFQRFLFDASVKFSFIVTETAITEPSKTSSTEVTTQNQPKEKDKEEISPTKGLFDKLIGKSNL